MIVAQKSEQQVIHEALLAGVLGQYRSLINDERLSIRERPAMAHENKNLPVDVMHIVRLGTLEDRD